METPVGRIFILALVLGGIAFLRIIENALKNVNEAKMQKYASDGERSAKRVIYLVEKYQTVYSIASMLVMIGQIFSAVYIVFLCEYLKFSNFKLFLTQTFYVMLLFVFGTYIPKKIATIYADKISKKISGPVMFFLKVFMPFAKIFAGIVKCFMKILGIKYKLPEQDITEEEIKFMVDIGTQSGTIDPDEQEMIHNIFQMGETPASEIMTHRTEIDCLWIEDSSDVWEETISKSRHSVYPVCGETVDDILGIVNSKDFYRMLLKHKTVNIQRILKTPAFVPETLKADELLKKMQLSKNHFAVVLDEYGGTAGIITMSDMLEEIVGNLEENEEVEISKKADNIWITDGIADLDEVFENIGMKKPKTEFNTVAGLILSFLDTIPKEGTNPEVEIYGLRLKVLKIKGNRIEKVRITLLKSEGEETEIER